MPIRQTALVALAVAFAIVLAVPGAARASQRGSAASSTGTNSSLPGPRLDLDIGSTASAERGRAGVSDPEQLRWLGRRDLLVGIGFGAGGVIGLTIAGIHRSNFSSYCIYDDPELVGCQGYWTAYDQFFLFPGNLVAVIGGILGALAVAGAAVLIVSALLRLDRAKQLEGLQAKQALHWGFRWGAPVASSDSARLLNPPPSPGLRR